MLKHDRLTFQGIAFSQTLLPAASDIVNSPGAVLII